MEEAFFPVDEEGVGDPDLGQERPVQRQLLQAACVITGVNNMHLIFDRTLVYYTSPQPLVHPGLPEVAVEEVNLIHLIHWPHAPKI